MEDLEADLKVKLGKVQEGAKTQDKSITKLEATVTKKKADIGELELEASTGLLKCFGSAKGQDVFIYSDLDVSILKVYKIVSERELLDDLNVFMADAEGEDDVSTE